MSSNVPYRPLRALVLEVPPPRTPDGPPDETLIELALAVRAAYVTAVREFKGPSYGINGIPAFDGGRDRWGTWHTNVWPKLARRIAELGADPLVFIRAQFHDSDRQRVPAPGMMLGDGALFAYEEHVTSATANLRQQYEQELASAQACWLPLQHDLQWVEERAVRHALFNVSVVYASPLFRVAWAARYQLADVLERFQRAAIAQYMFQSQAYDEAWGELVPAEIREAGRALRARLLGGRR